MKHAIPVVTAAALLWTLATGAAQAQGAPVVKINPDTLVAAPSYWTPARFKAAKPLPLPMAAPDSRRDAEPEQQSLAPPASSDAHAPTESHGGAGQLLFRPDDAFARLSGTEPSAVAGLSDTEPSAVGSFGAYYTSTRVFPLFDGGAAPYSADRAYPYRTVGILFFTIDGVPYLCSASVIQRRVVATAGHCVHSGTAAGFHDNWVFVPSYRDGAAPFKTWNWRVVAVTATWAGGGGGVPNAADYAMIEFADQPLTRDAKPTKLGNLTGWLGWQTRGLIPNHTSKLGYPCNLDNCGKMQDVTSNSFRSTAPNNVEYGSDARGGSSGGPWVQNFETLASGGGTGRRAALNRVVGVTSYGYVSTDPKVQGASNLDGRWVELFSLLCSRPGNCTP